MSVFKPIHWSPNHHISQKLSLITSATLRSQKLNSENHNIWEDLRWLFKVFICQGYPGRIIKSTMFKTLDKPIFLGKKI